MATKVEIFVILNELGLTEQEMNRIWQDNIDFGYNTTILQLHASGVDWKKLAPSAIRSLPDQLEKDKKRKNLQEKIKLITPISSPASSKPVKDLKTKLLSGDTLTEREISELINEYTVEEIEGDDNRWTRNMTSIVEVDGQYFAVYWQRGLTECQEDNFMDQPVKVRKHTYPKTITVTEWIPVEE